MSTVDALTAATYGEELSATIGRARRDTMGDLLWRSAARHPDKTAVVFGEQQTTFAELDATANRVANALSERGVQGGDRVGLLSRNSYGFVATYFASARLGSICVPINYMLSAAEVAYIVGHCEPSALIVEEALLPTAEEGVRQAGREDAIAVRAVIPADPGSPPGAAESLYSWMEHPNAAAPDVQLDENDPLELLYTSGTESRPKGTILTSRSVVAEHISCFVDGQMAPDDVEVHALPLFHSAQLHCFFTPDIHLGATSVILGRPNPAEMLAAVEAHRATKLFCPPTVWIALMHHPDFKRRDLSSLRKGYYGASIMPVEVLGELGEQLPDVRLFNFYGQTEMSPVATILGPEDQVRKAGSAGKAALNVETRVVDDDMTPVPPGAEGEIVHRSPQAMVGYWNDPEKTAETFRGGWLHTGDLGVLDEEGYLTVVDRIKDMIKTGGENVASREVEEAIYEHPDVAEVAVFGVEHPKWIEAVTAAVVAREGRSISKDELLAFCRERLAGFKTPKYVLVLDELPKNPSGKILKRELRTTYASLARE
jgi:fatty-acyl-CoA synthase